MQQRKVRIINIYHFTILKRSDYIHLLLTIDTNIKAYLCHEQRAYKPPNPKVGAVVVAPNPGAALVLAPPNPKPDK